MQVDIAIIGHFAKDRIVFRNEVEVSSGGSVYYGAFALKMMGVSVAVITKLSQEDFGRLEELRREGILVFARPADQTTGIENIYSANMDHRTCRALGFAGPFQLEEIPPLKVRTFLIGPLMSGEVDISLIEALSERGPVALDAQGFVRVKEKEGDRLILRDWPQKAKGLGYVSTFKADDTEAQVLTGSSDLKVAAEELAAYGPKEIVLTHSKGALVYTQGKYYKAPFKPKRIKGRTGRGDTFFAAYLGKRLTAPPEEACRFAAALTSLKLERPGPFRDSLADVERFLATTA
jgi:sugar/nucleoside kinase (ribokinase family)